MTFHITVVLAFIGRGGRWHFGPAVKGVVAKKKFENNWGKVTLDQCGKLVANYRKRLEAVKQNRGYATKY